jgi:hypothetical protein
MEKHVNGHVGNAMPLKETGNTKSFALGIKTLRVAAV